MRTLWPGHRRHSSSWHWDLQYRWNSSTGLERGLSELWTRGGLMYAIPL
jgi:hypothetical protein